MISEQNVEKMTEKKKEKKDKEKVKSMDKHELTTLHEQSATAT
jgi:hypothetical protein